MPRQEVIRKARQDKRAGKSASTQAGEFVKDQIDKIRKGKHGARSTKQAIAIGLSEARRAGIDLPPPRKEASRNRRDAAPNMPTRSVRASAPRSAGRACRKQSKRF